MKKFFKATILLLAVGLILTGCFGNKRTKEFSKEGLTVTLTSEFSEQEQMHTDMYLVALKYIFMSNRESKTLLQSGLTLEGYTRLVLANTQNDKNAEIKEYSDDDTTFNYAVYHSTVDGKEFSYLLVTLVGENHFYTTNFGTLKENFDKNLDKFMGWAKTVKVE